MSLRSGSIRLALCALLVGTASAWALAPHDKAVGVQAERHAQNGIQTQQNASGEPEKASDPTSIVPGVHAPSENGESQAKAQQGTEEGTEFWPPFYGYRFKMTDSIIAVFTALLFVATLALWWSTRHLVKSAEKTAEYQIRAYLYTYRFFLRNDTAQNMCVIGYEFKNSGQTPASFAVFEFAIVPTEAGVIPDLDKAQLTALHKRDVMPNTELFGEISICLNDSAIRLRENEMLCVWVVGKVTYRDVFKKERVTNARMVAAPGKQTFSFCPDGNDAT